MCGCSLIPWELQHAFREDRSPVFRCSPIKTIRTKRLFRLRWHGHGAKSLQTVSMLLQVNDSGSLRTGPRRQQLSRQTSQPPHGVRRYAPEDGTAVGPWMGSARPREVVSRVKRYGDRVPFRVLSNGERWQCDRLFQENARRHWRPALMTSRDCKIFRIRFRCHA